MQDILDSNTLGQLLDVGYMAVNVGMVEDADLILRNLSHLQTQRPEAALGLALLTWRNQGTEAALVHLETLREQFPANGAVVAFSAMVLAASDRTDEAIALARKLISSPDPETRAYARNLVRDLTATRTSMAA